MSFEILRRRPDDDDDGKMVAFEQMLQSKRFGVLFGSSYRILSARGKFFLASKEAFKSRSYFPHRSLEN